MNRTELEQLEQQIRKLLREGLTPEDYAALKAAGEEYRNAPLDVVSGFPCRFPIKITEAELDLMRKLLEANLDEPGASDLLWQLNFEKKVLTGGGTVW